VSLTISTGLGTGLVWICLGFTKILNKLVIKISSISVRGIQMGLTFILGWTALKFMVDNLFLSVISIGIILISVKYKKIPSAVILVLLDLLILFLWGGISISDFQFKITPITIYLPNLIELVTGMFIAGIAQLMLTLTNVMIATVLLIKDLFPEKEKILDANTLAINIGAMNVFGSFFGGIPLCHGSGGVIGQYTFGARTGGSMIMEGLLEIFLGLFFSEGLLFVFQSFPSSIFGAMLIYVAILLARVSFKEVTFKTLPIILISVICCFFINITVGFFIGLALYLIMKKLMPNI
jgi:hypothetical protein